MFKIPETMSHAVLTIPVVLMMASVVVAIPPARGRGQQEKDRLIKLKPYKDQPVEIVATRVKGTTVDPERKFGADKDWLNGMSVVIKNISDKPVIYARVSVLAYMEKNGVRKQFEGRDRVAMISLTYGDRPLLPGESPRSTRPTPLMPGQSAELIFSDALRDQLYSMLNENDSSTDIPELILMVDWVSWDGDDDTAWINGRMHRRDPNNPMRFVPVEPDSPFSRRNHASWKPKVVGS
jgi:hypothetical protein